MYRPVLRARTVDGLKVLENEKELNPPNSKPASAVDAA